MSSHKEVSTTVEVEPDAISAVGIFFSTIIEGVFLMIKHAIIGAVLGSTLAYTVAAQAVTEPPVTSEQVVVVDDKPTWRERISGVFSSAKEKAVDVKEGALTLVNRDEKLKLYRERIEQLEAEKAEMNALLYSQQVEVGVHHSDMVQCAQEVHNYLTELLETKGGNQ